MNREPRLSRRGCLVGAVAAACAGAVSPVAAADPRPALRVAEWEDFKSRFLLPDGRIVDTGNGNRSHSEGQGFAMVLATAYDDPGAFLRLWHWTRTTLQVRDDALLAWLWEPASGRVEDHNNASDGDLFVAWALLRAYVRWGEPAWRDAALAILAEVADSCVVARGNGRLLLPGAQGFAQPNQVVVNPSYWVYPALSAFATAGIPGPWAPLVETGQALVDSFVASGSGLVPDWCAIGDRIEPAPDLSFAFGFDAIRVPLYLRWAYPAAEVRSRLTPVARHAARFPSLGAVPVARSIVAGTPADYPMSLGGQAILLLTEHTVGGAELLLPLQRGDLDYYANVLLLLTKTAATEMPL